jgi:hypothetical protein
VAQLSHIFRAVFLFEIVLYHGRMTTILDRAFAKAKTLSKQRQNEIGEMMLAVVAQDTSGQRLSKVQAAEMRRRLAAPVKFLTERQAATFFNKLAN